MKMYFFMKTLG